MQFHKLLFAIMLLVVTLTPALAQQPAKVRKPVKNPPQYPNIIDLEGQPQPRSPSGTPAIVTLPAARDPERRRLLPRPVLRCRRSSESCRTACRHHGACTPCQAHRQELRARGCLNRNNCHETPIHRCSQLSACSRRASVIQFASMPARE